MHRPRRVLVRTVVFIVLAFASGCQEPAKTTQPTGFSASESPSVPGGEEELFGEVWENGARTTSSGYYATLSPRGTVTEGRLHEHLPSDDQMWVNPGAGGPGVSGHMFGWFDPVASGGCGSLGPYLLNDLNARQTEWHPPGPGQQPAGPERHCIRPGIYDFAVGGKNFRVDYLQLATTAQGSKIEITNMTAGTSETVEAASYTDQQANNWIDLVAHVDVTPQSWTETRALDVDNADSVLTRPTFTDIPSPSGTENDYFRFSAARSTSSWNLSPQGTFLARLYWDYGTNRNIHSNYYDPRNTATVLRHHQFASHVKESRTAVVALELMRPDEEPGDTVNVVTRPIQITRVTPFACDTVEGSTTWVMTDQYYSAACASRGPNIRYKWQTDAGGEWTPETADTLYDFGGHASTGLHQVRLSVRNTATGQSSTHDRFIAVNTGQVILSGPLYVTDKQVKTYTSTLSAWWFERWNPDLHWYHASAEARDWLGRIWYAGDYTVELRQQDSTPSLLRRGRIHITRCHYDLAPCQAANLHADRAASPSTLDTWDLFGGGPWISWGSAAAPRALRLYDLLGAHDGATPFTAPSWLDTAGQATGAPWQLGWRRHPVDLPSVRAFEFSVTRAEGSGPFVFGLALDPDLGLDAADDVAGYDAARGLAYVQDDERAVGYLLLDADGANAITSVQQFGLRRWAPRTPAEAWTAQRTPGVRLLRGPGDVQLVLSTSERSSPALLTLVMMRAQSLAELRAVADAAIGMLVTP